MIKHSLVLLALSLFITSLIPSHVYSQDNYSIPQWVKTNAKLWSVDSIDDSGFKSSIQYLIDVGIVHGSPINNTASQNKISTWLKIPAGWWADGKISDGDFINGIEYLIKTGDVQINSGSTKSITQGSITSTQENSGSNVTISQNIQNNPSMPTNTNPAVPPIRILLLVSNYPVIHSTNQYSFQAKVFDASQVSANQVDQKIFNQNWGILSGVRIQAYLTSSDNKTTFYTWDGLTDQFGYFVGSTLMRNEPTNQDYFVHFNATKSGMINATQAVLFHLVNSWS